VSSFKSVLLGFGKIGAGYSDDKCMEKYYPYATHAQVLTDHSAFDWIGVVEPSQEKLNSAKMWGVKNVASTLSELERREEVQIAVLATPPEARIAALDFFPNLIGVIVEKPLGNTFKESAEFVAACGRRDIAIGVNLFRRYSQAYQDLARHLTSQIGVPQLAFLTYGNGLKNNGVHMIDLVHMLLGPTKIEQSLFNKASFFESPMKNDTNLPFALHLESAVTVLAAPLKFSNYREVGLDIWGSSGRLQLLNEGLISIFTPNGPNRAMTGQSELVNDKMEINLTDLGTAMYNMYDNLANFLNNGEALCCDGGTALRAEKVIEKLLLD